MKQDFEIYFHLGLPKVASTFFQKEIFPKLADVTYYPKHRFHKYRKLDVSLLKGKYLFTSEKDKGLERTAGEITGIFPDARIILFFRRHDDWILSKYRYWVRKFGKESFTEFFDIENDKGYLKRELLCYREKIEHIEKMCRIRPLILTYDLLKEDPDLFIGQLTRYMNTSLQHSARKHVTVKTNFREKQLLAIRRFNRIYPYKAAGTSSRTLNKIHYKYREFLLHIVAFFSLFIPGFMMKSKSLLSEKNIRELEQIRSYFEKDWEYCKNYHD